MSTGLLLLVGFCLGFIRIVISGDCFWIDGTVAKGHTPCYDLNTVGASMCCATDTPEFSSCTTGGICLYNINVGAQGSRDHGQSFWRDSCTDRTWQEPACLAMAPYVRSSDVRLSKCADGSFCPRTENDLNTTCCNNNQGQNATSLGATLPASPTTSADTPTQTIATLASVSASLLSTWISPSGLMPSATSADVPPSSSAAALTTSSSSAGAYGLSKAAKIATIFGSGTGVLILGVALIFGINGWNAHKHHQRQRAV